jgi:uncharacterized protein YndB with AHSA1/START domain
MGERQVSVMINAPPEIVFGLYTDAGRVREWLSCAREVGTVGPTDQPGGRAVIVYRWPFKMTDKMLEVERPARHDQRLKELLGSVTCTTTAGSGGSRAEPSYALGWPTGWPEDPSAASLTPALGTRWSRQAAGTSPGSRHSPRSKPGSAELSRRGHRSPSGC